MSTITAQRWLEAQTGVIGSVLIDPKLAGQMLSESTAEDYSSPARDIYIRIQQAYTSGSKVDPLLIGSNVSDQLREYMAQAMDVTPSTANFDHYLAETVDKARILRLQTHLAEAANSANLQQLQEAVDAANAALIQRRGSRWHDSTTLATSFLEDYYKPKNFQTTGLQRLDRFCRVRPGDLVIIGARPSVGKTALAIQMALRQARTLRVGFFGLDTTEDEFKDRCMSHLGDLDFDAVQSRDLDEVGLQKLAAAAIALQKLTIGHLECPTAKIDDIFREAISRHLQVIYIDYLQLISVSGRDRYTDMTNVVIRMQQLARQHGITVYCISQLSRGGTGTPIMSDLRETGQIEQAANVIGLMYRENAEDADSPRVLKIAKNRGGKLVNLRLWWNGSTQTFIPIEPEPKPQQEDGDKQTARHWEKIGERSRKAKYIPMSEPAPDQTSISEEVKTNE